MNAKTFFRTVLLLFIAACLFFFVRNPSYDRPGQPVGDSGPSFTTQTATVEPTSMPANPRVVVYFFHGHHQCPSCRHLEAVSRGAIAAGFPNAISSGEVLWRAVDIESPANRHFTTDYQIYWSSLVMVNVMTGRQVSYKNLAYVRQIQQDDQTLRSYVQAQVRSSLGAS